MWDISVASALYQLKQGSQGFKTHLSSLILPFVGTLINTRQEPLSLMSGTVSSTMNGTISWD